eukprot:COSAG02_NODE_5975_length_3900_cov_35.358327_2_plen_178_part_00
MGHAVCFVFACHCECRYPLLILIYITTFLGATGDDVAIPFSNIVVALLLIVIPASIGMLAASKCPAAARAIEKLGSSLGAVFLVISIYWGAKDNGDLFDISKYTGLFVVAALFEPVGAAAGFGIATLLQMDDASRVRYIVYGCRGCFFTSYPSAPLSCRRQRTSLTQQCRYPHLKWP